MSLILNFINEINTILMTKRSEDDVDPFTLHMPEHKFKKNAEKFNYAITMVYEKYKERDVKLYHIILSLQEFFEMDLLVHQLLSPKLRKIVKAEMEEAYHIRPTQRRKSNAQKASDTTE